MGAGQSDLYENGSSGDTSEDLMYEIHNSRKPEMSMQNGTPNGQQDNGLWANSSRSGILLYLLAGNFTGSRIVEIYVMFLEVGYSKYMAS